MATVSDIICLFVSFFFFLAKVFGQPRCMWFLYSISLFASFFFWLRFLVIQGEFGF